jgi:hypothetical protein
MVKPFAKQFPSWAESGETCGPDMVGGVFSYQNCLIGCLHSREENVTVFCCEVCP